MKVPMANRTPRIMPQSQRPQKSPNAMMMTPTMARNMLRSVMLAKKSATGVYESSAARSNMLPMPRRRPPIVIMRQLSIVLSSGEPLYDEVEQEPEPDSHREPEDSVNPAGHLQFAPLASPERSAFPIKTRATRK